MKATNLISRYFGKFANYKFPKFFQKFINKIYVRIFDIDLSEFDTLESYESLNALFSRSLKIQRRFDTSKEVLISPCDCLITEYGEVVDNKALQIKGMEYEVNALLGLKDKLGSGYVYANFYLSPRDYHHYHAPCDLEVFEVRYFAGELLAVNKPSLIKNTNLFIRNERVVLLARDIRGEVFYFVAVGALNVGQMILNFEPRIQTNAYPNQKVVYRYEKPIFISKGEEIGMFKMGSTVVIFAKNISFNLSVGLGIKFSDTIGKFVLGQK